MKIINYEDIDFKSLNKLSHQGLYSTLYRNEDICFKILDGLFPHEKKSLYKKFLEMDGIHIDGVLFPLALIVKDNELYGYVMNYFNNSQSLYSKFSTDIVDCKELFIYLTRASEILRNLHENKIIYKDLNFGNILVNNDGDVVFGDLDGCCYKDYTTLFISAILNRFFKYREENILITENLDRISMLLSLIYLLYCQELQEISKLKYRSLSQYINTLENLKKYNYLLLNKLKNIPEIPYLDELIDKNDDYVLDRNKNLYIKI